MVGRFTARRPPASDVVPPLEEVASSALEGVSWTVFPEPAAEPAVPSTNPLLTDKLLDAKVRLHRRLIEEVNLSALEKLSEEASSCCNLA
jgi:pilus assembly protein CpaF